VVVTVGESPTVKPSRVASVGLSLSVSAAPAAIWIVLCGSESPE